MNKQEVEKKVFEIIEDKLGVDKEDISLERSLCKDLGFDSLDLIEVTMEAEMKFDILFIDEETKSVAYKWTVQDLVNYIIERLKSSGGYEES